MQRFYNEYQMSFSKFNQDVNPKEAYAVRDAYVLLPRSRALVSKNGVHPSLTRHARQMSFFSQFLLSPKERRRIKWSAKSDMRLLLYFQTYYQDYQTVGAQLFHK